MMTKNTFVSLFTSAVLLTGCTNGVKGLRPLTYQTPADTRLLVSYQKCPHSPDTGYNIAPIIGAVAVAAASQLLDKFGSALEKGAEGGDLPKSIAMTNIELDEKETPSCIIVMRGHFTGVGPGDIIDMPSAPTGDWRPLRTKLPTGAFLGEQLPAVYGLQHYVELQLISSKNKTALAFAPVYTLIKQSMDDSTDGNRAMSIELKFQEPGKDAIGSAVVLNDLNVGQPIGGVLHNGHFDHETPWFPGIHAPEATDANSGTDEPKTSKDAADKKPDKKGNKGAGKLGKEPPSQPTPRTEGSQANAQGGDIAAKPSGPFPYTVTATVVETRPTNEFLAFVASVFTSSKPTFESAIKKALGQSDQAAAK